MTIVLDHTIVPVSDKRRGARLLADLLGLEVGEDAGPFVPVRVNDDLTLDFDDRTGARPTHLAFRVDAATFAAADERARGLDLERTPAPHGVYYRDPDGIAYELLTP